MILLMIVFQIVLVYGVVLLNLMNVEFVVVIIQLVLTVQEFQMVTIL